MTVVDDVVEDLVPLTVDFDVVLRGYDRAQVQRYVQASEAGLRILTTDRDAAVLRSEDLARQVEAQRREITELRARIDRICRAPVSTEGLTERLRHMVELARDEAAQITSAAQAAAQQSWHSTQHATARLRERCERLAAELDTRRQQMEAEHRELLRQSHEELRAMADRAEQHRRELDERAAAQRKLVEDDFHIAMAARRKEAADEVAEARRQVDVLVSLRQRVSAQLRATEGLLTQAAGLLEPLPEEKREIGGTDILVLAEAS